METRKSLEGRKCPGGSSSQKLQLQRRRVGPRHTDSGLSPVPKSQCHIQLKGSFPTCYKGRPGLTGRQQRGGAGPDLCQDSPCPPLCQGNPHQWELYNCQGVGMAQRSDSRWWSEDLQGTLHGYETMSGRGRRVYWVTSLIYLCAEIQPGNRQG